MGKNFFNEKTKLNVFDHIRSSSVLKLKYSDDALIWSKTFSLVFSLKKFLPIVNFKNYEEMVLDFIAPKYIIHLPWKDNKDEAFNKYTWHESKHIVVFFYLILSLNAHSTGQHSGVPLDFIFGGAISKFAGVEVEFLLFYPTLWRQPDAP